MPTYVSGRSILRKLIDAKDWESIHLYLSPYFPSRFLCAGYLMSISELAAWTLQMKKICLTAFTSNPASLKFFQDKMKYKVDATDPGLCEPDEPPCGYRILSKIRA
eukprot:1162494-Amorphochlora_amoeboformis.AAC.1